MGCSGGSVWMRSIILWGPGGVQSCRACDVWMARLPGTGALSPPSWCRLSCSGARSRPSPPTGGWPWRPPRTVHKIDRYLNAALGLLRGEGVVCHYNCSDGFKPFPLYSYKPSLQNGCGSPLCVVHLNIGIPSLVRWWGLCQNQECCDVEFQCCLSQTCWEVQKRAGLAQRVQACGATVAISSDRRVTPWNPTWVAEECRVGVAVIFKEEAAGGDSIWGWKNIPFLSRNS